MHARTTSPRGGPTRGHRPPRCVRASALLGLAWLAGAVSAATEAPIPAVWKERDLFFTYRSSIAVYNCSLLEERIASVLQVIGARPDLKVRVTNCSESALPYEDPRMDPDDWMSRDARATSPLDRPSDRQQLVTIRARMLMPVEVTPDIVKEIEKDKSRRELIARVTGNAAARFNDPIVFAAERRVVTINRRTTGIEPVECELLDQMSARGFRELGVRIVRRGFVCGRNQVSQIAPELEVEALFPMEYDPGIEILRPTKGESGDTAEPTPASPPEATAEAPADAPASDLPATEPATPEAPSPAEPVPEPQPE